MAGKKVKHSQKNSARTPRNWTKRQMILDRVGQSQFMKDRRDRRALEGEDDWKKEDWGD
jgi:hypothetical protein